MPDVRTHLHADELPDLLRALEAAFAAARDEVDALNVFPVPDGDTGTNLLLTVRSAVDEVDAPGDDGPCVAAGRGAVRGARGNSGVIFSQVVRALAEALVAGPIDVAAGARVLARARDLAYEAVAEPVDGTILTAMDAAASAAAATVAHGGDLVALLDEVLEATADAVARTREQLEANRRAGVVDAGARGYEVALAAVRAFVAGEPTPSAPPPPVRRVAGYVVTRESGSLEYAFEVQYLLEAPDEAAATIRRELEVLGDSVVVVACGGLQNVHVHTNDIGPAIEVGLAHGRPSRIQVTSFADQIAAYAREHPERHLTATGDPDGTLASDRRRLGLVAVLPGPGLCDLAVDAGAVAVVGAAGALPSVADLLAGIAAVDAEVAVVLPGHPNVVPTARQAAMVAAEEDGRRVEVVATADAPVAVLAALAVHDPDAEDVDGLVEAAALVASGEVVAAVRDADTPIGRVRRGQFLAVAGTDVVGVADGPLAALAVLVDHLVDDPHEVLTVVVGAGVDDDERAAGLEVAQARRRGCEVEVVDGGQRPARWVVGVE